MLKQIREVFIILLCLVGLFWIFTQQRQSSNIAYAQNVSSLYVWTDSISVTTAGVDSFYTKRWEQCLIKIEGTGGAYAKFGAPDTSEWSSRDWFFIQAGESITFGPSTKLKRLEIKGATGTVTLYQAGYKTSAQY